MAAHIGTIRFRWDLWFASWLACGLLFFCYHYLGELAEGYSQPFLKPLINEISSAFGAAVGFFAVRALVRHHSFTRWTRLGSYLAAALVYSAMQTSWRWGSRSLLYQWTGLGPYDYGIMPLRYFMELPIDLIAFALMVAGLHLMRRLEADRQRQIEAAHLARDLADAKLANLQGQLQPHFLFNCLNAISSIMYQDLERADEMIAQLSDLLRASLRTSKELLVPLHQEVALLKAYVQLMQARFEERLEVNIHLCEECASAVLPPFLLQPLVENAIKHGGVETRGRCRVLVDLSLVEGKLLLSVEDDGPGLTAGMDPMDRGLGLSATAQRLNLLYGERQSLRLAASPAGGLQVTITLPAVPP